MINSFKLKTFYCKNFLICPHRDAENASVVVVVVVRALRDVDLGGAAAVGPLDNEQNSAVAVVLMNSNGSSSFLYVHQTRDQDQFAILLQEKGFTRFISH